MNVPTILDLKGTCEDNSTPLGLFCDKLQSLIDFRPGQRFFSNDHEFVECSDVFVEDNSLVMLIENGTYDAVIRLLDEFRIKRWKTGWKLCCAKQLRASCGVRFQNCEEEDIFCIAPATSVYNLHAIVHGDQYTVKEEQLERRIVEAWISCDDRRESNDSISTSWKLWRTRSLAQESIDIVAIEQIKKFVESTGKKGACMKDEPKYRCPRELIDAELENEGVVGLEKGAYPYILREFSDGVTLVGKPGSMQLPISSYFSPELGIQAFEGTACDFCLPRAAQKFIKMQRDDLLLQLDAPDDANCLLVSEANELYEFDLERLRVQIKKEEIPVYKRQKEAVSIGHHG